MTVQLHCELKDMYPILKAILKLPSKIFKYSECNERSVRYSYRFISN